MRVRFVQADLFPWLRESTAAGQRFDVVVLDPAKQTRDREEVDYALKRYLDMNRLALQAVAPGGIFLTCSCTGLVSEDAFLDTLRRAAWQAGRVVQVLRSGRGRRGPSVPGPRPGGALSQGGVLPRGITQSSRLSRFSLPFRPCAPHRFQRLCRE